MRIRCLLAIVIVCFAFAVPLAADCPTVINPGDPPCSPAHYYTVLSNEPDWCDYSYGDWVFQRWENINSHLTQTGWYVTPASDTTSHPPSSFPDQYPEDIVGQSCNLIWLPW